MKTLIVYASKHGCAKNAAEKLVRAFGDDTEVSSVANTSRINLDDFERVIVGGSIHAGRIQAKIKSFCQRNLSQLIQKQLGLYICHMEEDKTKSMKELTDNFPGQLVEHATALGTFGGTFDFEKMNFFERFIIKKIANTTESVSKINKENIANFITMMKD